MNSAVSYRWRVIALYALLAALGSATPGAAQTVTGQARAVQANVVGALGVTTTTVLADSGALAGLDDAREASAPTGSVPSVVTATTLHASAIGWSNQSDSEASVADLNVTVGATTIGADFVMARTSAVLGRAVTAHASIDSLSINGLPVAVTGTPNQTVAIPGGQVVINEQSTSPAGLVVNALHIAVTGVADVVVASATAGVR
jgi:hypothetical protein